ncbi:hypothetical protein [Nostoc sp. FACHB-133]|uniref:hypothetical protein n=1 Tax=Nostoc sp. FACHB-133 TaxID=2692835 RepID=UPI0019A6A966|nr:hypothetical protein [Nostoc sp. FACHB-133]MBD2525641.1 hypothetical protein [Nostoc sp. FACHB-133]
MYPLYCFHEKLQEPPMRCLRRAVPTHIYYVFSSTLLASCSEAMTERCGLVALVLLQRWVNNWRFVSILSISHLNRNSETCDAKLPKPMNVAS